MRTSISLILLLAGIMAVALPTARATEPGSNAVQNCTVRTYSGMQDPTAPEGARFIRYFTPEIGPYMARLTPGLTTGTGQLLEIHGLFANYPGSVLSAVTQPSGNVVVGTFKIGPGKIRAGQNNALLLGDLPHDNVDAVAQTGVPLEGLPTGVTIKKFLSVDGNGNFPFFLVQLQGAGVSGSNSIALCSLVTSSTSGAPYSLNILVRTGDSVEVYPNMKVVKSITTLVGSKGTLADGRWRCDFPFPDEDEFVPETKVSPLLAAKPAPFTAYQADGQNWAGILLTFTDGSQQAVAIAHDSEGQIDWFTILDTGEPGNIYFLSGDLAFNDLEFTSFSFPCFDGDNFSSLVNLAPAPASQKSVNQNGVRPLDVPEPVLTSSNNVALIYNEAFSSYILVSRKGDAVPTDAAHHELSGVTIGSYTTDPVMDEYGDIAIGVQLLGTPKAQSSAILFAPEFEDSYLIAQTGYAAPGGGFWKSFTSMVFAEIADEGDYHGGGLFFTGTLALSASNGVTASNNVGLWGTDAYSILHCLLRTGQTISVNEKVRTVKSFVALAAAPGSVGSAHGYDDDNVVAVVCHFTDGTYALVDIAVPSPGGGDRG